MFRCKNRKIDSKIIWREMVLEFHFEGAQSKIYKSEFLNFHHGSQIVLINLRSRPQRVNLNAPLEGEKNLHNIN